MDAWIIREGFPIRLLHCGEVEGWALHKIHVDIWHRGIFPVSVLHNFISAKNIMCFYRCNFSKSDVFPTA
jgi:hypothetical protein